MDCINTVIPVRNVTVMIQTVIVILILAVTAVGVVRWIVHQLKGGNGCSCGCSHCPHSGSSTCHCNDTKQNKPCHQH